SIFRVPSVLSWRPALPRPHRRGLIEARNSRSAVSKTAVLLFRGLTAAASLKHVVHAMTDRFPASLPRPHRRGLIEAGSSPLSALLPVASSAASPPRPH